MRLPRSQRRARRQREIRPPLRRGINAMRYKLPAGEWKTLGEWAVATFGQAGEDALAAESFYGNFQRPLPPDYPYRSGEKIWIFRPIPDEPAEPVQLEILAETEHFLAIDKPHGMASIPRGQHVAYTAVVAARRQLGNDDLICAHRLDLETAGVLLLVKKPAYRRAYQLLFQRQEVEKRYLALALAQTEGTWREYADADWHDIYLPLYRQEGNLQTQVGEIKQIEGEIGSTEQAEHSRCRAVQTHTRIRFCGERQDLAGNIASSNLQLWEVRPQSGFTHQIRAVFNYLEMPILGDPLYPQILTPAAAAARSFPLQLIAKELHFTDPYTEEEIRIFSRAPLILEG